MARIGSQGLVDDGSPNLSIDGTLTANGPRNYVGPLASNVLAGSGSVGVPTPGFYFVPASGASGQGFFTGSVPLATSYPGSTLIFTDTLGAFNWLLTGSSYATGRAVFSKLSGSQPGSPAQIAGTSLSLPPSGSVVLVSDGFRWLVMAGSGSVTVAGLNA